MAAHGSHEPRGSKQHAQLRDDPPRRRPLWVYDEEDWRLMTELPSGSLVCPETTCRAPFTVPIENDRGTRFLRDKAGSSCPHAWARPDGGGGPMSAQHRWLQSRVARICEFLGHEAITEHFETRADVFVPDVRFIIEIQLRPTKFRERTAARAVQGRRVLWLLPEGARGRGVEDALFTLPAARVRVHARGDRGRRLEPWLRPEESHQAVLSVYGTVAKYDERQGCLVTRHHDGREFLHQVLSGARQWCQPGTHGLPLSGCGAWVLTDDLRLLHEREADAELPGGGRPDTVGPSAAVPVGHDDHVHDSPPSVEVTRDVAPSRPDAPVVLDLSPMHEEHRRPLDVAPQAMATMAAPSNGANPDDRRLTWWQRLTAWVWSDG